MSRVDEWRNRAGVRHLARALVAVLAVAWSSPLAADYVGSLVNRIFIDPASLPIIVDGYQDGDEISFILETTPADTGSDNGHAAWMTVYVPAGAEVIGAAFVSPATNGGYDPIPAEDTDDTYNGWGSRGAENYGNDDPRLADGFVNEVQQDTGIFYSTDPRTQVIPGSTLTVDPTGVATQTVFNQWDYDQTLAYGEGGALSGNGGNGNTPLFTPDGGSTWIGTGSIVAGPDTYYTNDYDPACDAGTDFADDVQCVGPWNRIASANSKLGGSGPIAPATEEGPILLTAVPTGAGFVFAGDPVIGLPDGFDDAGVPDGSPVTNALRFVHGKRRLGEIETARIVLRIRDETLFPQSFENDTFCLDSTGGDTSDTAAKDNPFRYYEPQHECNFLSATSSLLKTIEFVNNEPSNGASLSVGDIIGFRIRFTNTSGELLENIALSDVAEDFFGNPTNELDLIEPGNPLCAWPDYNGDIPGPSYNAGSASGGTATWATVPCMEPSGTDPLASTCPNPADQLFVDQITVFLCAEVVGGGVNDRVDNTAEVNYDHSTGPVTLRSTAGGTISTLISGHVYADADGSGDLTPGDAGVAGVTITLYEDVDGDGMLSGPDLFVDSILTLSDGSYSFAGIPGADYIVVETDPAGWTSTGDKDNGGGTCGSGNGCNTIAIPGLASGDASTLNDFFDAAPAGAVNVIEGTVFADADSDSLFDAGEQGRGGIRVRLFRDNNGDGLVDLGDTLLQTQLSDADGEYAFVIAELGDFVLETDLTTLPFGASLTTDNVEEAQFSTFGNVDSNNDFGFFGGVGTSGGVCFIVADSGDELFGWDIGLMALTDIGPTGTSLMEAIAYQPRTNLLYGANAGTLGVIDQGTGAFTPVGGTFGTCTLPSTTVVTVSDVDGLSFDPYTGILWGANRRSGSPNDVLLQIDPLTGTVVPDAFGPGVSCIQMRTDVAPGSRQDIDDIAVDPTFFGLGGGLSRGEMYGISNSGGVLDRLVRIDTTTGAVTDVGLLGVGDMEGLGFESTGVLYGTTGGSSTAGDSNSLWTISKSPPPTPSLVTAFPTFSDYEAVDCTTAGANVVEGTVYTDVDADQVYDPPEGEVGQSGVTVRLYIDENGDGQVDAGDTLIQTTVTDADGEYEFFLGADGNYVLDVDTATLPAGGALTTDNLEAAAFIGFNQTDLANDFGFIAPSDLVVTKSSDAVGDVVAGQVITYTVTVSNTSPTTQTGIRVFDPTPTGTTYEPATTIADGDVAGTPAIVAEDDMESQTYSGGTGVWIGNWEEINDDAPSDPGGGDVRSVNDGGPNPERRRIRIEESGTGIFREVDLSAFFTATLQFDFRRRNLDDATRYVAVEVSGNGGGSWTELDRFTGPVDGNDDPDDPYQSSPVYDITPFLAADTRVRFVSSPAFSGNDQFFLDNVRIVAPATLPATKTNDGVGAQLLAGDPAELVIPGDGFVLEQGAVLTVTFQVRVEDPLDPNLTRIFNEVTASSEQSFPARAWVNDPVSPGGSIGDRVWLDVDGDGVQDIGEPGLPNVEVTLFLDDDGTPGPSPGDTAVAVMLTGADGLYLFDHLPPGTYYVDVTDATVPAGLVLAPGSTDPSVSFTITADESFLVDDFGFTNLDPGTAIIGDRVWSDADADGVQDPGEIGIGGVSLDLVAPGPDGIFGTGDDSVVATVLTAADGTYLFTGVAPGEYVVDVADTAPVLAGYTLTSGPQSNPDPTEPLSVAAGDILADVDFGYVNPGLFTVSDRVWLDLDGDGVQDAGEEGIQGVTVNLLNDLGEVIGTAVTDVSGDFDFAGVPDGDYTIEISDTSNRLAGLGGTTSSAQSADRALTVAGADISGVNFGYNAPGTLGDTVFSDPDANGVQDPGEPGIAGVVVELWRDADGDGVFDPAQDDFVGSATTDAAGRYLFRGLTPGTYFASVDDAQAALAGYSPTTTDEEPPAGTQIQAGLSTREASFLEADFGYRDADLASVSGTVWNDTNADGVNPDAPEEPGITGVTVDLVVAGPDGIFGTPDDVSVASTTTDANGDYIFPGVSDGDYRVVVTDRSGALEGYTLTSGLDAIDVTVDAVGVGDVTDIDFGYVRAAGSASIGDTIWYDLDRDGIQDSSEPGIGNTFVALYDAGPDGQIGGGDDVFLALSRTDAAGQYLFDNLPPGNYYVLHALPPGLVRTDSNGTGNSSNLIALSEGEFYDRADFGYATAPGTVALGDTVWADADGDGIQQPGEIGIAGITVRLLDDMGVEIATTVTGPDGYYLFPGLALAEYTIEVDPAGLAPNYGTTPTNGPISRDFNLAGGFDILHADFGFPLGDASGSIGDTVFLDADGDGVQGAGEGGLAGVTISLLGAGPDGVFGTFDDEYLATTTTDQNGEYDFVGLPAGDYQVLVTDVDGVVNALNLSAGTNPTATITLAQGEDYNDADFPYAPSGGVGSIGGTVWHDTNQSVETGTLDPGETGFSNVTVRLWLDVNGDGVITPGIDNLVRTTATDFNGEYEFLGLPPGNYVVDVDQDSPALAGFTNVLGPNPGVDNNGQTDPYPVTLTVASPNDFTADFAWEAINPFVLSGLTYFDSQGDAMINGNDEGVGGVSMLLFRDLDGNMMLDPGEPLIGRTTSAPAPSGGGDPPEGFYEFVDLPNGDYIVVADPTGTFLSGTTQTTQSASGGVQPATIADADSLNNDFGYFIAPTSVLVTRFGATVDGGRLVVEWETASQVGTVGFYLYRWAEGAGDWQPVNQRLLPAAMGAPQGAVYRFVDEAVSAAGVYDYSLVEIESSGGERAYGPYRVKPDYAAERAPMDRGYTASGREPSLRSVERLAAARRAASQAGDRAPAGASALSADLAPAGASRRAKVAVEERGIHYLSAAEIAAALGLPEARVAWLIRLGRLELTNRGEVVAYQPAAGGAGLYLLGAAADSVFTRQNVYQLSVGEGEWMATADGGNPVPVAGGAGFNDRRPYEEDRFAATLVAQDPDSDYWFWEFLSAGSDEHGRKSFELVVPDPADAAGEARLEIRLFGATDTPAAADHHAVVRVNGVEVGEAAWNGVEAQSFIVSFPQALLTEGANVVEVEALLDGEAPYSVFYVDGFDLSYARLYRAEADRLEFRGSRDGVVTVGGFASPDIRVYELEDDRRPRVVTNLTINKADGYQVSLLSASPETAYLAVSGPAVLAPVSVWRDRPSDLRGESAEYVVIAASELVEPAAALADYRRTASGLSTVVVDLEDVYDEFNHGLASPEAIRRFLAEAYKSWRETPRFVALVGAGNYDYRDLQGMGGNLLPPLMTTTPYGLFGSDQRLVDVTGGDGVPEMAIGRIPVLTAAELGAYVEKLAAFEAAGGALGEALLAADNADVAGDFAASSEAVAAGLPEGVTAERVYLDDVPVAEARERLFELLSGGIDWVNYVGHGGLDRLAEEGLVVSGDAASFAAGGRTPVVTSLTCSVGRFAIPGFESLAEALVVEDGAGAVAVWSPAGQSLDPEAAILNRAFVEAVYGDGAGTLGEAIRGALERYAEEGHFRFMLDHYNLLGDPALELE